MARLDIAERRKPQDGKIKVRMADRDVELRVATLPTAGVSNEDIVLRILTASKPMPLEQLYMTERNVREFRAALEKSCGLILCVGPTGSGKPPRSTPRWQRSMPANGRSGPRKIRWKSRNVVYGKCRSMRRLALPSRRPYAPFSGLIPMSLWSVRSATEKRPKSYSRRP